MEFYNKKKISIIVENTYQDQVISLIEKSGASGFTIYTGICGKGRHGIKKNQGGLAGFSGNIEVVTIVGDEVANKVLKGIKEMIDREIVLIVHVHDVQVLRDQHFS